jgi:integrase
VPLVCGGQLADCARRSSSTARQQFEYSPGRAREADRHPGAPAEKLSGRKQYATNRERGMHARRHCYASVLLADGVSIKELAAYLGHADPSFTLRVYAHVLPGSHDRAIKAIDRRMGGAAGLSTATQQSII